MFILERQSSTQHDTNAIGITHAVGGTRIIWIVATTDEVQGCISLGVEHFGKEHCRIVHESRKAKNQLVLALLGSTIGTCDEAGKLT